MHSSNMHTQPQPQHHALLFYEQPCSSNTVFLSLPQPSLQPSACGAQTISPLESNADVQNWVVKPVRPKTYEAAVATSHESSDVSSVFHSAWSDSCAHQFLPNETSLPALLPNQTKTNKPMQCEVCKIECNSKDVFEEHILGNKHKRNMQLQNNPISTILSGTHADSQIQTSSVQGQQLFVIEDKESESKTQKLLGGGAAVDSVRLYTICNIACNSQEAFSEHLAGKRHAAQVGLPSKKFKVAQPAWCEVCNIHCNSKDAYISHLFGKKHLKKLEKPSKSKNAGAGVAVAIVMTNTRNNEIEPQEKTGTGKPEEINSHKLGNAVTLDTVEKDIKRRKRRRKVVGGAAATYVKWCTLCNVMCNSEMVFHSHLDGQKHAAMVKKQ